VGALARPCGVGSGGQGRGPEERERLLDEGKVCNALDVGIERLGERQRVYHVHRDLMTINESVH